MSDFNYNELGRILEQIHMGVTIADGSGTFVFVGDSYIEVTGLTPEQLIGKKFFDKNVSPLFSPCVTELVFEKKEKITTVQKVLHGAELFVTGIPVFDKENILQMIICYSSWNADFRGDRASASPAPAAGRTLQSSYGGEKFICASRQSEDAVMLLKTFAAADRPSYICGPQGCGKHFLAYQCYKNSGAVYDYDCHFRNEASIGADLFGSGGIVSSTQCKILILRDIDWLTPKLQLQLIEYCQKYNVLPIGLSRYSLEQLNQGGRITERFYYYFKPYAVECLPLNERPEDLKEFIDYYMKKYNHIYSRSVSLSVQAKNILLGLKWEENISGLRSSIERLVLTAQSDRIDVYSLPKEFTPLASANYTENASLNEMLEFFEGDIIRKTYEKYPTTISLAKKLGISQATAVRKIQKYITPQIKAQS